LYLYHPVPDSLSVCIYSFIFIISKYKHRLFTRLVDFASVSAIFVIQGQSRGVEILIIQGLILDGTY
jgi:hypothetical protein